MPAIYRVDKFVVPDEAREEFWVNVRRTHAVLRSSPADARRAAGEALRRRSVQCVTIVRWESSDDLAAAGTAVAQAHRAAGFRPAEFLERAGIDAGLANHAEATA